VDIVVGFVELHGHAPVLERLQGSEAVPLRRVATRAGRSPRWTWTPLWRAGLGWSWWTSCWTP
jgi:hypothetical protein